MKTAAACRVAAPNDEPFVAEGNRDFCVPISHHTGALHIIETVSRYGPGESPLRVNPTAEEAYYVVSGEGFCEVAGACYELRAGTAGFLPPGKSYRFRNVSPELLTIVSVRCPQEEPIEAAKVSPSLASKPRLTLDESERTAQRSGDRQFKLLVDKDIGCQQVTQFIGTIPPSKAPFHFHTYEEAIYILEGSGIVHAGEPGSVTSTEFAAGSTIFLPIGMPHCLENPGPGVVRLLGVFYPSGSPGTRYDSA